MTDHRKVKLDDLKEFVKKKSCLDHHYLRDPKIDLYRIKEGVKTSYETVYILEQNVGKQTNKQNCKLI